MDKDSLHAGYVPFDETAHGKFLCAYRGNFPAAPFHTMLLPPVFGRRTDEHQILEDPETLRP